jgi:hypothetical protein
MKIFCVYSYVDGGAWHVSASPENLSGLENLPSSTAYCLSDAMAKFKRNAVTILGLPVTLSLQSYTYE